MDYTYDTAQYLLRIFLCSRYSLKYKLEAIDLAIIRYIGDSIDLEFFLRGKKSTILSYDQIAEYARCSSKSVQRCISKIKQFHIYKVIGTKGWKYKFSVGMLLTAYAQKKRKLSPAQDCESEKVGLTVLPSDISFAFKDNNNGVFKNVKIINKEIDDPEHGKNSLKILEQKLKVEGKLK